MSSSLTSQPQVGAAESAFRAAFLRLKLGKPQVMPKGTPVTQNNVAREAGRDPSALKKDRYPGLIREIKAWVEQGSVPLKSSPSPQQAAKAARRRSSKLEERIEELKRDRDLAQSLLVSAQRELLELWREVHSLRARVDENVSGISGSSAREKKAN